VLLPPCLELWLRASRVCPHYLGGLLVLGALGDLWHAATDGTHTGQGDVEEPSCKRLLLLLLLLLPHLPLTRNEDTF
jgi:hypothetical protein